MFQGSRIIVITFNEDEEVVNTAGQKVPDLNEVESNILTIPWRAPKTWVKNDLHEQLQKAADKLASTMTMPRAARPAEKPAKPRVELPEAQVRARHREAVTRAMALVDGALNNLPATAVEIAAKMLSLAASGNILKVALIKYLESSLVIPGGLPAPTVDIDFLARVRITSGDYKAFITPARHVTEFIDNYGFVTVNY